MIDPTGLDRVLMLFAHPDDETLAAGGTIARLVRGGTRIHVAIAATGSFARRNTVGAADLAAAHGRLVEDARCAMAILGVTEGDLTLGPFPDNAMDTVPLLDVIQWLEAIIDDVKPQAVFTHHQRCTNIDHRICHEAAVVATRPLPGQRIALLAGEVPSSTGILRPTGWEPNCYMALERRDLDSKIAAMQAYAGEARPSPHPRSPEVLTALATLRGAEAGTFFAEAFMIERWVL